MGDAERMPRANPFASRHPGRAAWWLGCVLSLPCDYSAQVEAVSKGQQTGLAATYLVAGELVLYGYNAVVTSRNMQGSDMLVENPAPGRSVAVQVKANRATFTDFLVEKARLSPKRFYVFVNIRRKADGYQKEY